MTSSDTSKISAGQGEKRPGPYLARVISHLDSSYMGNLQVEILRPSGNTSSESEVTQVKYMSPFYGVTSERFVGQDPNDYNNTQKSYGMWMIPPDVGTTVIVIFIDGDPKRGFWIGCVQDEAMNFMLPGYAATEKLVESEDSPAGGKARLPVGEYNKKSSENQTAISGDMTKGLKPKHPLASVLKDQGLLYDSARGITTSSARREVPSMVFGISTPGPLDKKDGSPRGPVGKAETMVPNAPVSRLGGSSFVMDDGDERWLRKKTAGGTEAGPPEYASIEQQETDGKPTIPHNELIRIRTRTGHQILMHNSEDLIYIGNSRGTTWIELSSDGKIDIFAEDSVSIRTKNDFNFYADRDINMEAGRNFNLKVKESHVTNVGQGKTLIVGENNTIKVGGTNNTSSGGLFQVHASGTNIDGGNIHLNSGNFGGDTPEELKTFDNPTNTEGETLSSIMMRVPTAEPYPHHENLDPMNFKPDKLDRKTVEQPVAVPDAWRKYSTTNDTFNRQPPPANEENQ